MVEMKEKLEAADNKNRVVHGTSPSIDIDLMGISSSCSFALRHQTVRLDLSLSQKNLLFTQYNSLASEIEVLTCRNKELEEKLEKLEAEKDELERKVKCNREVVSTR